MPSRKPAAKRKPARSASRRRAAKKLLREAIRSALKEGMTGAEVLEALRLSIVDAVMAE